MAKKNRNQRKEYIAKQPPAAAGSAGPDRAVLANASPEETGPNKDRPDKSGPNKGRPDNAGLSKDRPDKARPNNVRGPKEPKEYDPLHEIALGGLMLLLFLAPYFRGLFFAPQQEVALLLGTLIFWVAFIWRQGQQSRQPQPDKSFLSGPLDWFVLLLPLLYIIAAFTAVNKGLAIDAVVKNILYFMIYWSASRLLREEANIHRLLQVIYVSAIGVALGGLAMVAGIINLQDGFNVTEYGPTISSTLQYHNALGSFLGAVFFIGLYLWHGCGESGASGEFAGSGRGHATARPGRPGPNQIGPLKTLRLHVPGYLYAVGNFLLLAVLIGSKSRAGLLVFGLVFIIYLIGAAHQRRLTAALSTGYLGAVAYVSIGKFLVLGQDKQQLQAWLWLAGGLVLALVGQFAYTLLQRYLLNRWVGDSRKLLLTFVVLAAIVIVAGGIWGAGKTQALERMTSPQYLWTAYQRLFYINSSVEMIRERPLLGWGGGGWQEAYEGYMHFQYTTREAHSYPFQVGVETGLPGIVIVVGIWLSFLLLVIRGYRNSKDNPQRQKLLWLCTVVFLMLAGHALVDFDLSLSALALLLWTILGLAAAQTATAAKALRAETAGKETAGKKALPRRYRPLPLGAVTIVGLLVFMGAVFLLLAAGFDKQASAYAARGQADASAVYLEKAIAYNPFASDYRLHLSQLYLSQGKNDQALAAAKAAVSLSQYNVNTRISYIQAAAAAGNNQLVAAELDKLPALAPNNITAYEQYAMNYLNIGANELSVGHKDIAKTYLTKAVAVPELITKQANTLTDQDRAMWNGPLLEVNQQIQLTVGQADYCLGRSDAALPNLRQAAQSTDQTIKAQALLLLALMAEKSGNQAEHNSLIAQVKAIDPKLADSYAGLQKIPVL